MDMTRTSLTEKEIAFLLPMGVQFWTDYKTGLIHISRRWWNGTSDSKRDVVAVILTHMRRDSVQSC